MTDDEDEYGIGKPIDEDYIDVEKRRADVSTDDEVAENDNMDRSPRSAQRPESPLGDMTHIFDMGSGNGASSKIDELIDQNAVSAHDGRASTRTFFYTSEAPERTQRKFKRLYRHQEGVGEPQRDVNNRAADRMRTVENFCGFLDMSTYHRERVTYIADGLNMAHMAHYNSDKVILAVISLVANEDDWFIRDNQIYRDLMDSVGTDMKELRRIRDLIRRKSDRL